MKKTLKKIISLTLAAVMSASTLAVTAFAEDASEDYSNYPGGVSTDVFTFPDNYGMETISILGGEPEPYAPGDVDGNCLITANDARLALRASAGLENLTEQQMHAADSVLSRQKFSASNARRILRAAAKIEVLYKYEITIELGNGFEVSDLYTSGSGMYDWYYSSTASDHFDIWEFSFEKESNKFITGAPVERIFLFKPKHTGTYTIHFMQMNSLKNNYKNEFYINIHVVNSDTYFPE